MTVAFDASSHSFVSNDPQTFTHTPVGTPRGVAIFCGRNGSSTDDISDPTYGGVPLTRVRSDADDVGEPMRSWWYFLGSGIPTGAQTVSVDKVGTHNLYVVCVTLTGADDLEVVDHDGTSGDIANPSVVLQYGGRTCQGLVGMMSGQQAPTSIAPLATATLVREQDMGSQSAEVDRQTTPGTSDYTAGFTATIEDVALSAIAISEVEAGGNIIELGQAIETDTAGALAEAKTVALAQAVETDSAQAVTLTRLIPVAQAVETDSATALSASKLVLLGLATETDEAGSVSQSVIVVVEQATETDTAAELTEAKRVPLGQAEETDSAQALLALKVIVLGLAEETDTAQDVTHVTPPDVIVLGQAEELDRAHQITLVGGVLVVSEIPILVRAPSKAGRIFHEIEFKGDTYHPNVAAFQAEEEAPGGFGPAVGRISERIFRAHRDVFRAGANWLVYHEDGTCLHYGRLLQPDTSDGEVQLADRGVAHLAEREVGPILYQAAIGDQLSHMSGKSKKWTAERTRVSHSFVDAGALWTRDNTGDTAVDGAPDLVIPLFGRQPVFLRAHVQGSKALMSIFTTRTDKLASVASSAELSLSSLQQNYYLHFTPTTGFSSGEIEVDLTLGSNALAFPNAAETNVGDPDDTGIAFVYPEVIVIEVGDDDQTTGANRANATEVLVSNIEVNGVAVGEKRAFSAHDLVADIAALIGIRHTAIEGGGIDVLPYELPAGTPASEPLDWASLLTGKRTRILHNGNHPVLEFGAYAEHTWGLASPWSPFDAIPQDRYDAVAVPFVYGATQLDDQVIVKLADSPLDRRNIYWGLGLSDPAHNQDKARNLGALIAEQLVRKRNAGSFAAAEVIGPDGEPTSAHHVNAGDEMYPMRPFEEGRLRISHLTRFDDHVEGTFDGGNHALDRMLARREKKLSRR